MDWLETWNGYLPPTSNTTYTPNQFFDVVIPASSRGTMRLVAYLIRKTLGWSDAYGRPQNPLVKVSYRELDHHAGIARNMLRAALDEAIAGRFIECVEEGRPDSLNAPSASAVYKLRWDVRGVYVTDPAEFQGFFAGNGNLTYIPNQFFDETIPNETLAVVRVVGVIIRNTIGWQTEYGFRRQQVAMSFTELEARTNLSRQSINLALRTALAHRHLTRVEPGTFHAVAEQQKATVYAVKWADAEPENFLPATLPSPAKKASLQAVKPEIETERFEEHTEGSGSKSTPGETNQKPDHEGGSKSLPEAARKVDQRRLEKFTRGAARKVDQERLEKLTREAARKVDQFKITDSKIKTKKQKLENDRESQPENSFATAAFSMSSTPEYTLLRERGLGHKAALEFEEKPRAYLDATWELVQKKHKSGMSLTGLYCAALRDGWLEERQAAERARVQEAGDQGRSVKPVRTAQQELRERNLPRLRALLCRTREEAQKTFSEFTAFCEQERTRLAKRFSHEAARQSALQSFEGEENMLKLFVSFLKENPCPFPDEREWIENQTPAALMKMFG